MRPYVNFCQLSVRLRDLPLTFVNFLCIQETICQFSVRQQDLPTTSVNFPYICGTFRKLPLTFYASAGTSIKYQCSSRISLNIRQLYVRQFVHGTFRQLPSKFCLSVENILCGSWTFRLTSDNFLYGQGSFRQVFMRKQDLQSYSVNIPCSRRLPSTCVNISCGRGTYRQLSVHPQDLSPTFRASEGPSINFLYVRGRSINFHQLLHILGTFR